MPIRTRRGRISAYRAGGEWPLHSPARLVGVAVALVVLAVLVSFLVSGGTARSGRGALGPAPAPQSTGGSAAPAAPAAPPPELTPTRLPASEAPPAALAVATRWVQAWADHPAGTTGAQWSARLAPFTTDEYLPTLASVDPANVPGSRVTGAAQAVEVRPETVRVQVPTDAVRLQLLLVQVAPGDWRVAGYDRAP